MEFLSSSLLASLIGLVFIYALLSILVSILVEWYNHRFKTRGKMLQAAVEQMLNDPLNLAYGQIFFEHPMVRNLANGENRRPPQYLAPDLFAEAVVDLFGDEGVPEVSLKREVLSDSPENQKLSFQAETEPEEESEDPVKRFRLGVEMMAESPLRQMLLAFHRKSGGDYQALRQLLMNWYQNQMDRVSGWYKTKQRSKLRWAALAVTLLLNVDSIFLFHTLRHDDQLRDKLTEQAVAAVAAYQDLDSAEQKDPARLGLISGLMARDSAGEESPEPQQVLREIQAYREEMELPFGWSQRLPPLSWFPEYRAKYADDKWALLLGPYTHNHSFKFHWYSLPLYLLGLALTVFALSFGAPFWFETLMKLTNLRQAGKKPRDTQPQ